MPGRIGQIEIAIGSLVKSFTLCQKTDSGADVYIYLLKLAMTFLWSLETAHMGIGYTRLTYWGASQGDLCSGWQHP